MASNRLKKLSVRAMQEPSFENRFGKKQYAIVPLRARSGTKVDGTRAFTYRLAGSASFMCIFLVGLSFHNDHTIMFP